MRIFITMLFLIMVSATSKTQNVSSPILFIYDASGSMWGQIGKETKKQIASDVLGETVDGLADNQAIGLIAYGHRKKGDCDDIEELVPLNNSSKSTVKNAVTSLQPLGKTPLARSAEMALSSLKKSGKSATVILITDGIESCDGDLCKVITNARAAGIEFKWHIVGFGLTDGKTDALKCAAQAGGGHYYDVGDAESLSDALREVTERTVDKPDANFSLYAVKNGEAVDAWVRPTLLDSGKEIKGSRTYRDTAHLFLPPGKYRIDVRPLEGSDLPSTFIEVVIEADQTLHRDVRFDGGSLSVFTTNNGEPWDAMVKMLNAEGKAVASTRTYGKTKTMEVPAGVYRVTYTALAMEGLDTHAETKEVVITAGETTAVTHNFLSGLAYVGARTADGTLIDATVNFHEIGAGKNVAAARTYTSSSSNPKKFILSPGTYEVKVVTLGKHKGQSDSFTMTVKAGETVERILTF